VDVLRRCGVEIEKSNEKRTWAGIGFEVGAKVVLMPDFGVTLREIKSKIKGKNFISAKSSVVLDGDIALEDVSIDGSVWIKGDQKVASLNVTDKNYVDIEETSDENDPRHIKIRGYKAINHDKIKFI